LCPIFCATTFEDHFIKYERLRGFKKRPQGSFKNLKDLNVQKGYIKVRIKRGDLIKLYRITKV